MTAAVICLSLALVGAMSLIAYLARNADQRADEVVTSRDSEAKMALTAERARWDATKAETALKSEQARAAALEELIAHEEPSDPGLDPRDVDGRIVRLAQRWREANVPAAAGAADPVRPDPVGVVRTPDAPKAPTTDVR